MVNKVCYINNINKVPVIVFLTYERSIHSGRDVTGESGVKTSKLNKSKKRKRKKRKISK